MSMQGAEPSVPRSAKQACLYNEAQSLDTYIGHLLGLLKTQLPATVFALVLLLHKCLATHFMSFSSPGPSETNWHH